MEDLSEFDGDQIEAVLGILEAETAKAIKALIEAPIADLESLQGKVRSLQSVRGLISAEWTSLQQVLRRTR